MADIFLSYSSEDIDRIEPFVKMFEREKWSVWWDYEIYVGDEFPQAIEDEIKKAGCVVVLWSENSIKSKWVKIETYAASEQNKLVPALIDNVAIPFQYSMLNTAKLYDWDKKNLSHPEVKKFLRSIKNKIESSELPKIADVTETPAPVQPDSIEIFSFENKSSGFDTSKTLILLSLLVGIIAVLTVSIIFYRVYYLKEMPPVVNTSPTPSSSMPVSNNSISNVSPASNNSTSVQPNTNSIVSPQVTPDILTGESPITEDTPATPVKKPNQRVIREIIISETETKNSGAKLAEWLNSQETIKASYHIIIDYDGVPYFMTDLDSVAYHTPQHNNNSVGIGLSHLKGESYSEAQLNGLIGQLANLAYKYKIRPENIKSKQEINPERYPRDITIHMNFIREKVAEKLKQI